VPVNDEVTAADIARIAGVGRAAVSNWRRRHPDFPAPVGGPPNSPTFALADVEAWLTANGRTTAVNTTASRVVDSATAYLARAMAALLPARPDGTVLDPACGDGSLLAASAQRLGPQVRYVGWAADPDQVDLARAALASTGARRAEVTVMDDPTHLAEADAVISITPPADPPTVGMTWEYGQPSRADQALGWVQVGLSHLKPRGTAVLAVPFATAVRSSARRIRAELLRAGALTDVIALPEKAAGTASPSQIWVLTRPVSRPAYLLRMVDLTDRAPRDLPHDDATWAAAFADPERTRDVPSIELLDEDVYLVPAAYLAVPPRDLGPEYTALGNRYATAAHALPGTVPALVAGAVAPTGSLVVTVADLARSGALTYVDRDAVQPGDVVVPPGPGGFEATVLDDTGTRDTRAGSALRCDPAALDPYFLACFLRSEINRRQAAGTMGGTFRLDVRRARVPRMPIGEQRRYGEAFRRLMEFASAAEEVAAAAAAATSIAIDGLTSGTFAPEVPPKVSDAT
jgi:hypothetical protein